MSNNPIRIIQISDMHIHADPEGSLLGVKTEESFKAVLELVKKEKKIDLIILSGDLSQDGSERAYKRLADLLKPLNVPVCCIPGNHDNPKVMESSYPCHNISSDHHIIFKNWHFILLNSQKPGAVEGVLDPTQLDFLKDCLQKYPEHHAIVVFHHQPIPVGSQWLDQLGLTNANEFWKVVQEYPQVRAVLFGHVHQEFEYKKNGIKCYSVPSTCIQFARNKNDFGLDNLPPGYRWLELDDEGKLETGVKRVAEYVGTFDPHAKGY